MSFASMVKERQVVYITRLLSIFGVVEERQMRSLFSFLSDQRYGAMISVLHREGTAKRSPDAKYIASSRMSLTRTDIKTSVMCFWAFIAGKDKVLDFCAGEAPTMVTISGQKGDYDIIPVTPKNIEQVNLASYELPESTVRLLVTDDLESLTQLDRRVRNDLVLLVGKDGVTETYEL